MKVQKELLLRDVPREERPRERMMQLGAEGLSNVELIALLLRTGSEGESVTLLAQRVLSKAGHLCWLSRMTFHELTGIHGIGPAKAIQLLAGIELGRRVSRALPEDQIQIYSPSHAVQYVMEELKGQMQEVLVCLFLNMKNEVIDKRCIFKGTLNSVAIHPREIFSEAIKRHAAGVICIHNHPSGDPTPSQEDIHVTRQLMEAGGILGIDLVDHVIIGERCYYSMREEGWLSENKEA